MTFNTFLHHHDSKQQHMTAIGSMSKVKCRSHNNTYMPFAQTLNNRQLKQIYA